MNFLYLLLIGGAAAFLLCAGFIPARLNHHIDRHAIHFILAESVHFRPARFVVRKLAKYFLFSVITLLVALNLCLLLNWTWLAYPADYMAVLYVGLGAIAALLVNSLVLFLCCTLYMRHKVQYTPVL